MALVSLQFQTQCLCLTTTSKSTPNSLSSSFVTALIRPPSLLLLHPSLNPHFQFHFQRKRFSILSQYHNHNGPSSCNYSQADAIINNAHHHQFQFLHMNQHQLVISTFNRKPSSSSSFMASSLSPFAANDDEDEEDDASTPITAINDAEEEDVLDAEEDDDDSSLHVDTWDVLGLGQAMVDFSGVVDDGFLESLGLQKGTRKLVNHEERGKVLRAMDGCSYKAAAGGSLSNTLVALARLGCQPAGGPLLNVAMTGSVGSDPLGGFYRAKLRRAGVNFLSAPVKDGTTGTVIVLTTPDAQRTMLAYQGTSSTVNYDPGLSSIVSKTNILVVEGYLFELPDTIKSIKRACKDAHSSGALVAVTASDVSCIERHYDDFWEIIGNYADIVFANSDEARALCNFSVKETPASATRYLSHFVPLVSVTDGPRGSYIGVRGEAVYIPPSPCVPVDTCGAGDAYASGILYGILRGVSDLKDIGTLAARVAAVVVGQQGTRLRVEDALELAESFAFHLENSAI